VVNAAGGLAVFPPPSVIVVLSGEIPMLRAITPDAIVAEVDAQGLDAGLHLLPVSVTPPPGTSVASIDPPQVGIALSLRE
jgi:hypothetical protein